MRHWSTILGCALVGLLLGAAIAFLAPASYRSTATVLITRLAVDELGGTPEVEPLPPIETEIRFVNSTIVRNAVRESIPTAPDAVDVELADQGNLLEITASADTIDEAQRLARSWASAFINQRQDSLIRTWQERTSVSAAVLEELVNEIGVARLALDDVEVERLEARRTVAATEEAQAFARLEELQTGPGAEIFEDATRPTSRSGAPLLPASLAGVVLGALIGVGWTWGRDRRTQNDDEARSWLDKVSEGTLEPVLTARELDIPSFLEPSTPLVASAAPTATPPVSTEPEPVVAAAPVAIAEPATIAPLAAPAQPAAPAPPAPASAPARAITATSLPRPSVSEPLRVVQLSVDPKPTRAPRRSASDEAWADDFALVTDR